MECNVKNDWCKIRKKFQTLTYTYLLKKDWEEGFLTLLRDTVKQITNAWTIYYPTNPSKYIEYLDMNNFYRWAMSGYLPYSGFKWLKNVDNFDVNSSSENSPIGYILEVDL